MASPQTEDGFVMVAIDLFAALLTADFTNAEMIVLARAIAESYGPEKRKKFQLSPPELEAESGLHRNNLRAAIKSLVTAEVLIPMGGLFYSFNKDWEGWKPKHGSFSERLSGKLATFAEHLKEEFRSKKSKKKPIQVDCDESTCDAIQSDVASTIVPIQSDVADGDGRNPTGLHGTAPTQSNWIAGTIGTRTDAGARRVEREEKRDTPQPPDGGQRAGDLDSSEPTEPKGGGPGKNSAEAIALEAWAAPFGTDPKFMGYGFWAREACEHYPAEWVRLALEDHVVGRSARPYIGKLTAVLLRYAEQGHPDRKPGRRVAAVTPKPAPQLIRAPAGFQSGNPVNALPSAPSEVDPSNVFTQIARRTETASPRKPQ